MKAPLRPFEYMAWAKSVPRGARYDLTASGVADVFGVDDGPFAADEIADWNRDIDLHSLCRRTDGETATRELSESVARRYDLDPSCVTVTLAASAAIMHVLIALIRAGDHVVVERPTYEALRRAPEILGAVVSRLDRRFDDGWAVVPERLAQLLTPRTRAVILTNLHNPTGVATDSKALHAIAELASRVGAMILVDEVYLDHVWPSSDPIAMPAATVARNTLSWTSTTKAFGVSAIRAGWIVTPDADAARAVRAAADYLHVNPPVATARLGTRVLDHSEALLARARGIAEVGRQVIDAWIAGESRVAWIPPSAGLTGFVRLPSFMQDIPFAEHLRQRYDTQVVPGSMFEAPGFVRVSFGIDPALLKVGLESFSSALDDLTH